MSTDLSTAEAVAEEFREAVAEEVRVMMARKRLSQSALAERAGMSTSTLARRLSGESDFTLGELFRLAQAFGVSTNKLIPAVGS